MGLSFSKTECSESTRDGLPARPAFVPDEKGQDTGGRLQIGDGQANSQAEDFFRSP